MFNCREQSLAHRALRFIFNPSGLIFLDYQSIYRDLVPYFLNHSQWNFFFSFLVWIFVAKWRNLKSTWSGLMVRTKNYPFGPSNLNFPWSVKNYGGIFLERIQNQLKMKRKLCPGTQKMRRFKPRFLDPWNPNFSWIWNHTKPQKTCGSIRKKCITRVIQHDNIS